MTTKSKVSLEHRVERPAAPNVAPTIILTDVNALRSLFDSLRLVVVSLDRNGVVVYANGTLVELLGEGSAEDVVGRFWFSDFLPIRERPAAEMVFSELLDGGMITPHYTNAVLARSGEERVVAWNNALRSDTDGRIVGTLSIGEDLTAQKRAEEIILRQTHDLLSLANPILQIWDGILLAPLIGTLDGDRAAQFTERLLATIVTSASRIVIIDVTGVPLVDTRSAQCLTDAVSAARLVGAKVFVTGMRPALAQAIVSLGIDLLGVLTLGTLEAGLRAAMSEIGTAKGKPRPIRDDGRP